jgi:hypothetical protein
MTIFKDKITDISWLNEEGNNIQYSFSDLAILCLNSKPEKGGYSIIEMAERLSIIDKLKECKEKETVELEAKEVLKLQEVVKFMSDKWQIMHKDIVEFDSYIMNLK